MQVKESKSKQKCKFFHKPLAKILKIYSFECLPIIKKVIVITKSPQNRLWLKFTSRMVWYTYFRFGAITVPSKFYDNITLFTLKLHAENNSDFIQNHLWTTNDVTVKDPMWKIPHRNTSEAVENPSWVLFLWHYWWSIV